MPRLNFRFEARTELASAINRYSSSSASSAAKFVQTFNRTIAGIGENPRRFPVIDGDVRQARIVLFFLEGDDVVVISCFHGARHPRHWRDRRR